MKRSVDLHIKGIVQGVGFRPFVYREAKKHLISGWVLNASDGVHVHAEGEENLVDDFILALSNNAPAAAEVKSIDIKDVPIGDFDSFEIRFSENTTDERTLVSPDLSICDDCLHELFDEGDPRYHYPFINCTNCGPRYTIIESLPYDRDKTCMKDFRMCKFCENEYKDPLNRRFHAQPVACFECGPHLELYLKDEEDSFDSAQSEFLANANTSFRYKYSGDNVETSDAIISYVTDALLAGKIVAIKGLGGYHLACDANNSVAISNLRSAKQRDNKAFAVMADSLDDARGLCNVSKEEADLLNSSAHPIVLLVKNESYNLPDELSGQLPELGVMLPYTPLQALILRDFKTKSKDKSPLLVMTSGNISDEPIVIDDLEALQKFDSIADIVLGNNRDILARFDDSVVRILEFEKGITALQTIRRARGFAPRPIEIYAGENDPG